MGDKGCCVCLKRNACISLSSSDHSDETIKNKLQTIVAEVQWEDTFSICRQCIAMLNVAVEFRNLCLRSNFERMKKEKPVSSVEYEGDAELGKVKLIQQLYSSVVNGNKAEVLEKDKYYCKKCDLKISWSEYEDHVKKHTFMCFHCNKSYKIKGILARHIKMKHQSNENMKREESESNCENMDANSIDFSSNSENEEVTKLFKCSKCEKSYKSKRVMVNHMVTCDGLKIENQCQKHEDEENPVKKNFVGRSYSCEVCSKVFGYVKQVVQHCVEEHQMEAKSVRPYLCDKCQRRFISSTNLIQHKQYHNGERSHICSFCGKSFITSSDLTVHEYTHMNRRNYKCDICHKAYNTNKNLRSHKLVVHTDSSEWKYKCEQCDKRFPLKSGYDQHARRHAGDKRFKCMLCQKSFISSSELTKHNRFHSFRKDFKCSYCEKDYKDRRVYQIHLKKAHGIGDVKIPVRVKKFACSICPGMFVDKDKLSRHMCTHTGIKPFVCSVCKKGFSDKSYLKHHLKTVHEIVDTQSDDANYLQIV